MKRYGHLYEQIISMENLRLADQRARCGKKRSYGVQMFDKNAEANLQALHLALKNKTFTTSPYSVFTIHDPKEREIFRLPYYPDRIVHHAIIQVLEPIWIKTFTHNTFACIKGRGIQGCADYTRKLIDKYKGRPLYCLKTDITKFYPSIDHAAMKAIVRKKIKDNDLLWLLDNIIDSTKGLPIGNYTSQFLANLYLAYFMHHCNEELHIDCAEYADDMVFFTDNKEMLHKLRRHIEDYFSNELRINLKGNYQVFPIAENRYDAQGRALDFIGFNFYRNQTLIRKTTKKHFAVKAKKLNKRTPLPTIKEYKKAIAPWLGWAYHSNSRHLLKKLINPNYYESILRQSAL